MKQQMTDNKQKKFRGKRYYSYRKKNTNKKTQQEAALEQKLKSLGLVRVPVPQDGNCLFRVIADNVYHSQTHHRRVREECIAYLESEEKIFKDFIKLSPPHITNYNDYLKNLKKETTWGGEVELRALSAIYKINIHIFQIEREPTVISKPEFKNIVRMAYVNGNHYDIIYEENYLDKLTYCQGLIFGLIEAVTDRNKNEIKTDKKSHSYQNFPIELWLGGKAQEQKNLNQNKDVKRDYQTGNNKNQRNYRNDYEIKSKKNRKFEKKKPESLDKKNTPPEQKDDTKETVHSQTKIEDNKEKENSSFVETPNLLKSSTKACVILPVGLQEDTSIVIAIGTPKTPTPTQKPPTPLPEPSTPTHTETQSSSPKPTIPDSSTRTSSSSPTYQPSTKQLYEHKTQFTKPVYSTPQYPSVYRPYPTPQYFPPRFQHIHPYSAPIYYPAPHYYQNYPYYEYPQYAPQRIQMAPRITPIAKIEGQISHINMNKNETNESAPFL